MAKPEERVYEGLAQVAHAIRRSMALYVASTFVPPDATVEDLKVQADDLAEWIRGHAGEQPAPGQQPLGVPWGERD